MNLTFREWGYLHHFFELVSTGKAIRGQYGTYWQMGHAILRAAPEAKFGFLHPVFRNAPPASIWTWLYIKYWRGRMLEKKSHRDMLEVCHNGLSDGLKEILGEEAEVICDGSCGVPASGR